jgi:hypothetical protein
MTLLFAIEASTADGTMFRMALGWSIHSLASWLSVFGRLI